MPLYQLTQTLHQVVNLTYDYEDSLHVLQDSSFSCYEPLRLVMMVSMCWTPISWDVLRKTRVIRRNIAVNNSLLVLEELHKEFEQGDRAGKLHRSVYYLEDVNCIVTPTMHLLEAITKLSNKVSVASSEAFHGKH